MSSNAESWILAQGEAPRLELAEDCHQLKMTRFSSPQARVGSEHPGFHCYLHSDGLWEMEARRKQEICYSPYSRITGPGIPTAVTDIF